MHRLDDTIVAPASPVVALGRVGRTIIRIAGPKALGLVGGVTGTSLPRRRAVIHKTFVLPAPNGDGAGVDVEALLYVFPGPRSYTGDDVVEMHVVAAACIVEAIFERLRRSARPAEPGEFTRRAFLNGRMDLAQAEAVAQIVSASNTLQLAAAENLYAGRLGQTIRDIREDLLELLALVEADLDFGDEPIEVLPPGQAVERLERLDGRLAQVETGSLSYEGLIDLPAVGLAGAPNAGKSTLLNRLLGSERSIVSSTPATTRDVLSGVLELERMRCALFDCAGLMPQESLEDGLDGAVSPAADPLDALAQHAAQQALAGADVVVFCVDVGKTGFEADRKIWSQLPARKLLHVATQCDRVDAEVLTRRLERLTGMFGAEFLPVSAQTGTGIGVLRRRIEQRIATPVAEGHDSISVNQRHRQCIAQARRALGQAQSPLWAGQGELAAVHLREAIATLDRVENEPVDEQVLDRIFARFCIGK